MKTNWIRVLLRSMIVFTILVVVAVIVLTLASHWFNWGWTGITGYQPPQTDYVREKTLWDWLELFVAPLMLAILTAVASFTFDNITKSAEETRKKHEEEVAKARKQNAEAAAAARAEVDRGIAHENRNDTVFGRYLDRMSALLLDDKGLNSLDNEVAKRIARARTLTVLAELAKDGDRKGKVVQFLQEADLVRRGQRIVDLRGADLSEANLHTAELSEINLSETKLSGSDMNEANLNGAILKNTVMEGARLDSAILSNACMMGTKLNNGWLKKSFLISADLTGAQLTSAHLEDAHLQNAKLKDAWLNEARLERADLTGADLTGAVLDYADLTDAVLDYADLREAKVLPEQYEKARSLTYTILPDGTCYP